MIPKNINRKETAKVNKYNFEKYAAKLCKKIDEHDKYIHAFLLEKYRLDRILKQFKIVEKKSQINQTLHSLSVGVKDIFFVDGLPTRAGSNLPANAFHDIQASVVTNLINNGAFILGKTVSTEFALSEPNETINPFNHNYSPGGSSSGSAAAVAAGMCELGIGSQTVGSTLRPASYCSIVGFKPTFGRINILGIIPLAPSLDTVGLLTKNTSKLLPITKVVLNNWNHHKTKENKRVIGIPAGAYLEQADKDVLNVYSKTINLLKNDGYCIKVVPMFDNILEINENIWSLLTYEMSKVHSDWYSKYKDLYRVKTIEAIERGLTISNSTYHKILNDKVNLHKLIKTKMEIDEIDLWISPAAKSYPPKMKLSFTGDPAMNIPWTLAGLPSISLPINNSGILPLGLQIIAGFGEDEMLLSESVKIEKIIS